MMPDEVDDEYNERKSSGRAIVRRRVEVNVGCIPSSLSRAVQMTDANMSHINFHRGATTRRRGGDRRAA